MRIVAAPLIAVAIAALAACGPERRAAAPAANGVAAPGTSYSDGGVFTPYYGEEVYDGRIYVFGSKASHDRFTASHAADPLNSTTYIRRGPNHETVVVQTDKEQPQLADRIWKRFCERHHVAA